VTKFLLFPIVWEKVCIIFKCFGEIILYALGKKFPAVVQCFGRNCYNFSMFSEENSTNFPMFWGTFLKFFNVLEKKIPFNFSTFRGKKFL